MSRFRGALCCALVVLALLCLTLPVSAAGPRAGGEPSLGVRSTLEVESSSVGPADRAVVRFILANDGDCDLYVLRWQTPLAGVEADLFDVRRGGERVAYLGPLIKFGPPQAEDYLRIPAGGSRTVAVDLGAVYDLSRTGEYSVRYRVSLQDALRADGGEVTGVRGLRPVASNLLFLGVERDEGGLEPFFEMVRATADTALASTFVKCDAAQQATLTTALGNAESISLKARDYLNNLPAAQRPSDAAYRTWFGAYTTSRYGTVQNNFQAIHNTFATKTVSFFCDCKKKYYAYVYPNRPYEIHLCNVFWTAPMTGIDSKAGTLVHETSHFTVVAGTDDWAYGTAACQNLANTNPDRAIANADSHEYFAETR
ncbi:MAG TPA: M35 family metallo-endopeptidase [Thermoanaerobaculia bacterium]|nr:M35 family metallo-endopeptidase [Thermoanaerobaculia bacterium]